MKKTLIVLILILPFLWEDIQSQTISTASHEETFFEDNGRKLLIRANPNDNYNPLIYYITAPATNRKWYFLYHSLNGNAYKFLWPTFANNINTMAYYVYDMLILGNYCYFCGTKIYPTGSHYEPEIGWTDILDSVGFVGRISLDKINNPAPSVGMQLHDISGTNTLTKMDATVYSGDTLIALVGKASTPGSLSQLVLINESSSSWSDRVYPVNDPAEAVTDVIFTQNQLITVSMFENEHLSFGIRREEIISVHAGYSILFNYNMLVKFNTNNMTGPNSSNPNATWHPDKITALLSCIQGSDTITVAYQCIDSSAICPNSMYQTALFQIICDPSDISFMKIHNAQLVSNNLNNSHYNFVDMMYIPYDKTIALLHYNVTDPSYGASALQFAVWSTNDGTISNLLSDYQDYRSLDIFQNRHIYLAGGSQSDSTIIYNMQDKYYVNSQPSYSCYATRPLSQYRNISGGNRDFIPINIPKQNMRSFSCATHVITGTRANHITSCNIVTEH